MAYIRNWGAHMRSDTYRILFQHRLAERALEDRREATNKAWVLSNGQFNRAVSPKERERGG